MWDKARQGGTALTALFVVSVLIFSLFLLVSGYVTDAAAFNSDNLLSSAQCDDLLHGREMTEWHLPGAPYLFPDLLLLLPCQGLAPTLPIAFLAYCLLLHLSLASVLAWLGRLSGLPWPKAIAAAGCGCICLVAVHLKSGMTDRAFLMVHPGSHFAALVVGLLLLALTAHSVRSGQSWILAIVYLLIGGLGIFSDRLVVAQLLAPLGLALLLLAACRILSVKQAGGQLVLLGSSFLLSCGIKLVVERLGFHLLGLETSPGRLHGADLFSMLSRLCRDGDFLLITLFSAHLLAALALVWFWSRRAVVAPENVGLNRPVVLLTALTLVLSPPCIFGALFVLGMAHHPAINRYVLSCWFLPPLLLPLILHWLPGRMSRATALALQAAILLFALQRAWPLLPGIDRTRFEQPYPPLAQALDQLARQRGPLNGLAGFWAARSTSWFSREKVRVNALSAKGEPWFHASNAAAFLPDDDLRIPAYQFLVIRPGDPFGPSVGVLVLNFGMPAERIAAGTEEIWLYDSVRAPALDRFLRSRLADRLHRQRSCTGPAEPACLAHPKKSLVPDDSPGTLALGADQTCEIRFAQPVTGSVLDVGASADARLDVTFFHGDEQLGSIRVPSVPWTGTYYKSGLQSRLLPLPAIVRERQWDRLLIRALPQCENVRLGHVLLYAESIPGLDEESPLHRVPRARMEAEELLPVHYGMSYRDDPTASGGLARRSTCVPSGAFTHTPRLFLPLGRYRIDAALKVDSDASGDEVVTLAVGCLAPPIKLAERILHGSDFSSAGTWITYSLTFEVSEGIEDVLIGIVGTGRTPVSVDYLDLVAEPYP